jgi:hypothetical protein
MIVGPFQLQIAQRAAKAFLAAASIARLSAASAGQMRSGVIGSIPIQPALQKASGQGQHPLTNRHFQRIQIEILNGLAAQQALHFINDVGGQGLGERSFF